MKQEKIKHLILCLAFFLLQHTCYAKCDKSGGILSENLSFESISLKKRSIDLNKHIKISLDPQKTLYKLDESVEFTLVITNIGQKKIEIQFYISFYNFPPIRTFYYNVYENENISFTQDFLCKFKTKTTMSNYGCIDENTGVADEYTCLKELIHVVTIKSKEAYRHSFSITPESFSDNILDHIFPGKYRIEMEMNFDQEYKKHSSDFKKLNNPHFYITRE